MYVADRTNIIATVISCGYQCERISAAMVKLNKASGKWENNKIKTSDREMIAR